MVKYSHGGERMMGRRSGQMEVLIFNPEDIIPRNHLLRKIDKLISFEFVYQLLGGTYSEYGRPSIDPVCMEKML